MFFIDKFHFTIKDFVDSYENEQEWLKNQSKNVPASEIRFSGTPILYEWREAMPDILKILIGYTSFHANTTIIKLWKFSIL